jgi:acetyl-CoA C-acetyltransferase
VEKMTDSPVSEITAALATAADADWEVDHGLSFVALNALIMKRYMYEYGWQGIDFAEFAINAHANAVHNPYARFRKPITESSFKNSPMICDPINLMDASPVGDGAAAVILARSDMLPSNTPKIIVAGSSAATDTIAIHNRKAPLGFQQLNAPPKKLMHRLALVHRTLVFLSIMMPLRSWQPCHLKLQVLRNLVMGPVLAKEGEIKTTWHVFRWLPSGA